MAMESGPFIGGFPIKASIQFGELPMPWFDYQKLKEKQVLGVSSFHGGGLVRWAIPARSQRGMTFWPGTRHRYFSHRPMVLPSGNDQHS